MGEQNPETIILGRYATAGQAIAAPYSHGKSHRYLTHIDAELARDELAQDVGGTRQLGRRPTIVWIGARGFDTTAGRFRLRRRTAFLTGAGSSGNRSDGSKEAASTASPLARAKQAGLSSGSSG